MSTSGSAQPCPQVEHLSSSGQGAVWRAPPVSKFWVLCERTHRHPLAWVNDENSYGLEER